MTAEQKLVAIARVYDTRRKNLDGSFTSSHARYNLQGALIGLERNEHVDAVYLNTVRRVVNQLVEIENYLDLELHTGSEP